jgi:hypothetical protein
MAPVPNSLIAGSVVLPVANLSLHVHTQHPAGYQVRPWVKGADSPPTPLRHPAAAAHPAELVGWVGQNSSGNLAAAAKQHCEVSARQGSQQLAR